MITCRIVLPLAALGVLVGSCLSGPACAAEVQAQRKSADSNALKLLDAGREPRRILRLIPRAGQVQQTFLTVKFSRTVRDQRWNAPPLQLALETAVLSVAENGDIGFETVLRDLKVLNDPRVAPEITTTIRGSLAGFSGLSVKGTASNRGGVLTHQVRNAPNGSPEQKDLHETLKNAVLHTWIPLPEEAVGLGARWDTRTQENRQGVQSEMVVTWEIVSISGDQVMLSSTGREKGGTQTIPHPILESGTVEMTHFGRSASANVSLDLSRIVATGSGSSRSEMILNLKSGRQRRPEVIRHEVEWRFEPRLQWANP